MLYLYQTNKNRFNMKEYYIYYVILVNMVATVV